LIAKLLEIPNEYLLDSFLNLSQDDEEEEKVPIITRERQFSSDGIPSGVCSSGMLTPLAQSFSTPVQAKIYYERGLPGVIAATNLNHRVLDLRSPQTKFNLMRKLQEVKEELHGSSDEENASFQAEMTATFNNNRI